VASYLDYGVHGFRDLKSHAFEPHGASDARQTPPPLIATIASSAAAPSSITTTPTQRLI
jgi:hypothetical protein